MRKSACELCIVFIWREPRSWRVSRDLEKMLSRFLDFGLVVAALGFGRSRWSVFWKTGGRGSSTNPVRDALFFMTESIIRETCGCYQV